MKYLCDACGRLVEIGAFELRGGQLALSCSACGQESRGGTAPSPAPVLELARPKAPPSSSLCPKCAAPRSEGLEACPRCGLVYSLFNPAVFALPEEIEVRWTDLERSWNDPARHEEFLRVCNSAELLAEAVRRYRLKAEQAPSDALAQRYRDEAVSRLLALTSLPVPTAESETSSSTRTWVVGIAVALVVALLGTLVYSMLRQTSFWP